MQLVVRMLERRCPYTFRRPEHATTKRQRQVAELARLIRERAAQGTPTERQP